MLHLVFEHFYIGDTGFLLNRSSAACPKDFGYCAHRDSLELLYGIERPGDFSETNIDR
jgi:hypothetical protein